MTYLLVSVVVMLLTCACSMHFNLQKAAEVRADDLIEMAKQDNELIELRHNLAEHQRLHAELNQILHPNGDGPKAPSLCDLVAFVLADLRGAYKAGFIDAASNCQAMASEFRETPGIKESESQMIDAIKNRIEQVAKERAYHYVANGKRVG